MQDALSHWIVSCLVLGLRVAPVFAFAPPFSLTKIPAQFRVLFGLGIAVTIVAAFPAQTTLPSYELGSIVAASARELMLGTVIVLAFQLVFGALYMAGRTIDIQAGYGLALIIDPASQVQAPLVGTLFAYAAGAMFFAMDGQLELLRFLSASLHAVPLGSWTMPDSIDRLASFTAIVFLSALGVAGAVILALFLVDLVIAMMSRTIPQMNVLILGFQVKTLVLLLVLPSAFGIGGALLVRLMATTLDALPRLL